MLAAPRLPSASLVHIATAGAATNGVLLTTSAVLPAGWRRPPNSGRNHTAVVVATAAMGASAVVGGRRRQAAAHIVGTAASVVVAAAVSFLRAAGATSRRARLRAERTGELRAICVGLRIKPTGDKVQLARKIEEALARDDELCSPSRPLGRLLYSLRRFEQPEDAAKLLASKYRVEELRTVCRPLRLPTAGAKALLAGRIVTELHARAQALDVRAAARAPVSQSPSDLRSATATIGVEAAKEATLASGSPPSTAATPPRAVQWAGGLAPAGWPVDRADARLPSEDEVEEEQQEEIPYVEPQVVQTLKDERLKRRCRRLLNRRRRLAELLAEELSETSPYAASAVTVVAASALDLEFASSSPQFVELEHQPVWEEVATDLADGQHFQTRPEPMLANAREPRVQESLACRVAELAALR
mmetsp:Transcript_66843/g.173330  ORF Transcript_66843/g.173330 Transcript_66843/m.173330 type:complete len:417 (-) Transcript_66843:376-1626(-)|eukprot:CAMPEP_0115173198 /NCGR_PEP_ID=MMETSP0270-20121206/3205_1 /TAXON_ID=71861 /ORGANISM="Scrippsiella trochoidea, Strain CCMP3099" /LENGTH=416 /DNA_ID=CAMNT_0002586009 /DNA_START=36 /DNA_END=1286 /DNA_ORIENTATION=-